MVENNLFLLISMIFIILEIIIVFLFMNHLKFMRIFIEEMRREQIITHKEISEIKKETNNKPLTVSTNETYNSPNSINPMQTAQVKLSNDVVSNNQPNLNISELKSSQVSQEKLLELLKGTEQVFTKQVNIDTEKTFVDIDV